jgi:hypothetical protein
MPDAEIDHGTDGQSDAGQQEPVQGAEHVAPHKPGDFARYRGKKDLTDLQTNKNERGSPPRSGDGLPHPFPVRHQIVILEKLIPETRVQKNENNQAGRQEYDNHYGDEGPTHLSY